MIKNVQINYFVFSCYEKYNFTIQCPQCISSFQNNTIVGPYPAGLLKMSIIVNITSVNIYEASGFISAFIIPSFPALETGYVMNILSNDTHFLTVMIQFHAAVI